MTGGGNFEEGTAEFVVVQFIKDLQAGKFPEAIAAVSEDAKGPLKQFKESASDSSLTEKLKTALVDVSFVTAKKVGVRKMVVFENKKKKKTQFFVVRENDVQVINEIKVMN